MVNYGRAWKKSSGNRHTSSLTLREYMLGEECIDALGILDSEKI
jgi:hypothetical protein